MAGVNTQIPTWYVNQYSTNLELLLQQKGSRLRSAVMESHHVGAAASPVDQLAPVTAQPVTDRYGKIVPIDPGTNRRWVYPTPYDSTLMIDQFDKLQMLIDPTSSFVQSETFAHGRAMDAAILAGAFGSNNTGNNGGTAVTFPNSQVVGVQQGAASSTNLTVAKLIAAMEILEANEVDLDNDPVYCAINAANHASLKQEIQVTSKDFNDEAVLVEGKLRRFLGIDFIHTELLTTGTDDQSGTSTQVLLWAKSGLHLGIWNDIQADISQRKDLRGLPYQAYSLSMFGATRTQEGKVVKIWAH